MDTTLSANITLPNGGSITLHPESDDPGLIPVSISFGTAANWGFAEGSITLKRPDNLSAFDNLQFAPVTIYDGEGRTVYKGRIAALPRNGTSEVELDLEGWLAHLDDDGTVQVIYRDTDLSGWAGMSNALRINRLANYAIYDGSTVSDAAGSPVLALEIDGEWRSTYPPIAESLYDSGIPDGITGFYFYSQGLGASAGVTDFFWTIYGVTTDDPATWTIDSGLGDLQGGPTGSFYALDEPMRYLLASFLYNAAVANTEQGRTYGVHYYVAIYGNHGLSRRGTEPAAGFYASDVVADALAQYAPLVDIAVDGIEQSSFIIPHLVFREDTTARAIIEAVSLYGASGNQPPDYGYYEDGFFWKTPGTYGRTWRVRRDEATIPQDQGPDSEERINGLKVSYTDGAGTRYTVGPVGSGADYETDDLADDSIDNPVNAAGIPKRYRTRDVGITTQEGAILIGQLLLREANETKQRGSVQIKDIARDETGAEHPAYMVRFGDYVVIEDDEDTSPRKIVSTTYENGTVTASLDTPVGVTNTLLNRLLAANSAAGF